MKKNIVLIIGIFAFSNLFSQSNLNWVTKTGSRSFPSNQKIFNANAYGAVANDTTKVVTKAIQAAIDACAKNGGGIVNFNPGTYVTGSVF